MCQSKLAVELEVKTLSDTLTIDGINDKCDYIETGNLKDVVHLKSDLSVLKLNVRGLLNK